MKKWVVILLLIAVVAMSISGCPLISPGTTPENVAQIDQDVNDGTYVIQFFPDVDSEHPIDVYVTGTAGEKTIIPKIQELGIEKEGYLFEGWRLYRGIDNSWYLRDARGKGIWAKLEKGKLPEGCNYALREDGGTLIAPTTEGGVCLFAQWGGKSFQVVYHPNDTAPALELTQEITYGNSTPMLTLSQLGIDVGSHEFKGWKLYREIDGLWRVKADGKGSWGKVSGGKPAKGYTFSLFKDGQELTTAATSGIIHAYAQWG